MCQRELRLEPENVDIRLALSDAFMSLKQYKEAVTVLQQGFEHLPGDERIKAKLTLAESYLEEQAWIEKQQKETDATKPSKKQETEIRLSIIRCRKLKGEAAMAACNKGLTVAPQHPELLTGRGNVWLKMGRIGQAIADFEAAVAADPNNRIAAKDLRLAQTKRKVKMTQCLQKEGQAGLDLCDVVLIPGAKDEVTIQNRRGTLLLSMGKEKEAKKAYQKAIELNPDDKESAQALAKLTPKEKPKPTKVAKKKATPQPIKKAPPAKEKKLQPAIEKESLKTVVKEPPPEEKPPAKPKETVQAIPAKVVQTKAEEKPKPVTSKQPLSPPQKEKQKPVLFSNAPMVPGITH